MYKPLQIQLLEIGGLIPSMQAMRLPKKSESDSDYIDDDISGAHVGYTLGKDDARLAGNLIRAGNDHAKAMRGIIVWARLEMQVGWMIEFETYRCGVECLSTSSAMHGELKGLSGPELAGKKQAGLPDKVYTRICTLSYQVLRAMYYARRNHRHPDWRIFCDWIKGLPYADELILAKKPLAGGD